MSDTVYTYKCGNRDAHYHDRPVPEGEEPPNRVTCPRCGLTAGLLVRRAPTVIYRGGGWTGAQRGNKRG